MDRYGDGKVMLIGPAGKNAILIVEFAKVRRDAGAPAAEAAVTAARLRFRAVMMTALSSLLGVRPLVFASGAGAASRVWIGVGGVRPDGRGHGDRGGVRPRAVLRVRTSSRAPAAAGTDPA